MTGITAFMVGAGSGAGFRLVSWKNGSTGGVELNDLTIPKPAGTAAGMMLLGLLIREGGGWGTFAGWTRREADNQLGVYTRVADGGEGVSFTFTDSRDEKSGVMLAFDKADFGLIGDQSNRTSNPSAPSITLGAPGIVLAIFWTNKGCVSFTTPADFEPLAKDNDVGRPSWALFQRRVPAGATGDVASAPSADQARGVLIGIEEA